MNKKLETLYPKYVKKISPSIVAKLDNSKVSSIFRSKGNELPVGAVYVESDGPANTIK